MSWKLLLVTLTTGAFSAGFSGAVLLDMSCYDCHRCSVCDSRLGVHTVEQAVIHYQTDNPDACPRTLGTLVDDKYLMKTPLDAWGQPLLFVCPGVHNPDGADITSAGRDHLFGTADDIHS